MADDVSFGTQLLQELEDSSLFQHPEGVRQWVAELPLAHRGESLRRIYRMLWEMNQRKVPWRNRFLFCEELEPPLIPLLDGLRGHYMFRPFPLSQKGRKMAELATHIHAFLLISYKLILDDYDTQTWLQRRTGRRSALVALQQALRHCEEVVLTYRMLGRAFPPDLWRQVHGLYLRSAENGWLNETLRLPGGKSSTSHLAGYKRVLLLGMLDLHHLRSEQFARLMEHLDDWGRALDLVTGKPRKAGAVHFFVTPTEDAPPQPVARNQDAGACPAGGSCLLLNTDPIRSLAIAIEADGGRGLTEETLRVLLHSWWQPPERRHERHASVDAVEVLFGLSAIHRQLFLGNVGGLVPQEQEQEQGPKDVEHIEIGFRSTFHVHLRSQPEQVDVWDLAERGAYFLDGEARDGEVAGGGGRAEYRPVRCRVMDVSTGGYRLAVPHAEVRELRTGDLIAVRGDEIQEWMVGSIRWVSTDRRGFLTTGVQIHFLNVVPLVFRILQGRTRSDPQPCFLASFGQDHPVLILPFLRGLEEKPVELEYFGRRAQAALDGERFMSSPSFKVLGFTAGRVSPETRVRDGDLDALVQRIFSTKKTAVAEDLPARNWESRFANLFDAN